MRHFVVWLLALVVPLQGLAVCLVQVRGPGHTHVQVQSQEELLLAADFRRNLGRPIEIDPLRRFLVDAAHGHSHAAAQFHHHAFDDASVRYLDGERFGGSSDDDGAVGDGLGSFLPLPVVVERWSDPGVADTPEQAPLWTPTAAFRTRLDRPPSPSAV